MVNIAPIHFGDDLGMVYGGFTTLGNVHDELILFFGDVMGI